MWESSVSNHFNAAWGWGNDYKAHMWKHASCTDLQTLCSKSVVKLISGCARTVWNKLLSSCYKVEDNNRLATSCSNTTTRLIQAVLNKLPQACCHQHRHSNSPDFTGSLPKIHAISLSPDFYQILPIFQNIQEIS